MINSYIRPNTDTSVNIPLGYLVFVRGDRTVTKSNQQATTTTLRAKGTLSVGTLPSINIIPDHFQSIGNPYASPIGFTLITKSATVDTSFYVWDPYLYGTYGVGGYQVLSNVNGWKPVPGGTSAYPSGVGDPIIQSARHSLCMLLQQAMQCVRMGPPLLQLLRLPKMQR